MSEQWEKPVFEEVRVNGECTAYAAGVGDEVPDGWFLAAQGAMPPAQDRAAVEDDRR
jgi:hypothetical protein